MIFLFLNFIVINKIKGGLFLLAYDFKPFINSLYHKLFKPIVIILGTIKFKKIKINNKINQEEK